MQMRELDDISLLRRYAEQNSEEAFAELVSRHVNKVYSVALRHTQNPHQAEEITQAVFVILASKAGRLGKRVVLSGWLYQTARLTAITFIRSEVRRVRREREAHMQNLLNEKESDLWPQIAPLLDAAMSGLNEADRVAVVLRFFDGKSFKEVGATLGSSEAAAKMRLNRAMEKLRAFFTRRGVVLSGAALTAAISANSVQAAPIALSKTATTIALAKGATVSTSTLTLAKGALELMAWTKAKTAVVVGAGILLAVGTTTIAVKKYQAYQVYLESWRVRKLSPEIISKAPPQVRIVPTKFVLPDYGTMSDGTGKWAGINATVFDMVRIAYHWPPGRIVFTAEEPTNRYDFATTVPHEPEKALQQGIKKKFDLAGQRETRDTDVWVLKVCNPSAPGLKRYVEGNPTRMLYDVRGRIISKGAPISAAPSDPPFYLTKYLESFLKMPVIDETGLVGKYDIDFRWKEEGDKNHDAMKKVLRDQVGLELVPVNRPIEMLIVGKAK